MGIRLWYSGNVGGMRIADTLIVLHPQHVCGIHSSLREARAYCSVLQRAADTLLACGMTGLCHTMPQYLELQ